jgi:hypothetical protein
MASHDRRNGDNFNGDRNQDRKEPTMPDASQGRNRPACKNGRICTCPCCRQPNKLTPAEFAKGFVCEDCGE